MPAKFRPTRCDTYIKYWLHTVTCRLIMALYRRIIIIYQDTSEMHCRCSWTITEFRCSLRDMPLTASVRHIKSVIVIYFIGLTSLVNSSMSLRPTYCNQYAGQWRILRMGFSRFRMTWPVENISAFNLSYSMHLFYFLLQTAETHTTNQRRLDVLYFDFYFCFAFTLSVSLSLRRQQQQLFIVSADKKYHFARITGRGVAMGVYIGIYTPQNQPK